MGLFISVDVEVESGEGSVLSQGLLADKEKYTHEWLTVWTLGMYSLCWTNCKDSGRINDYLGCNIR